MRNMGRLVFAAVLAVSPAVAAQVTQPGFEVASIKVNRVGGPGKKPGNPPTPVGTGGVMTPQGNRFAARNATLRTLIRFAYGNDDDLSTPALLPEYRVVGGPPWVDSEAFDIVAIKPESATRELADSALMLRALLAERFALKVHTETREFPAYALVRARPDVAIGPQLRASSAQCTGVAPEQGQVRCGVRGGFQGVMATGASMPQLAAALYPFLGVMVVDRTMLPGTFDFNLRFTDGLAADARFPSLFTAVEEQLGLKLESTHAPADVVVIDGVQRLAEN